MRAYDKYLGGLTMVFLPFFCNFTSLLLSGIDF